MKRQAGDVILQHKTYEIKGATEEGSFEGFLSVYNEVDQSKEVVEPGAFKKTILERGKQVPLLWQHKSDTPIGTLTLIDGPDALRVKGQLLMSLGSAQEAYKLIKAGIVKGLSIGFETIKDSIEEGVRHLKEIKLYEGSLVTFPCLSSALVTSVKSKKADEGVGDFLEELTEIQTLSAFYQMQQALREALEELIYADVDDETKIAGCNVIVEQFAETFSDFFPAYLKVLNEVRQEQYGPSQLWSKIGLERKAKDKTKRVDGEDLTSDCFAYVGDKEDLSTWKLPIKFSDEEKTKAHIRNALARFSQTQGIPEEERPKVLAKIKAAAKKHGIEVSDDDKAAEDLEVKVGAMLSAANLKTIGDACEGIDGHVKSLKALCTGKAGDATLQTKAADAKTEPVESHSAIDDISQALDRLKSLISV